MQICEALATRGALPSLGRGTRPRRGRHPWSAAFPRPRDEADRSEPGSPDLPIVPPKIVERTLERPVIGICNQTVTNWIVPDIQPFNVIAVAVS
jgi:hypothetical protein